MQNMMRRGTMFGMERRVPGMERTTGSIVGATVGLAFGLTFGLTACTSDDTPSQVLPPTTSPESAIASPTDPAATMPPTSTAEKVIPESGTPATESVYLEVDVENDAPAFGSMVVGSPVRVVITSDVAREFVVTNDGQSLSGTAVAFEFVADEVGLYEIEDAATGELVVSLEAITE